jgi:hypothetical protein
MIDYDELDERIRRIVREEMKKHECGEIDSLENANTDTRYTDSYGDVWEFDQWNMLWRDTRTGRLHPGSETDYFGPFTAVKT